MTDVHERFGVMDCMGCKKEIPVKRTKHGTLSAPCAWCEFKNYARPGTEHYKNLLARVRLDKPEPAPAPNDRSAKPAEAAPAGKLPWMR